MSSAAHRLSAIKSHLNPSLNQTGALCARNGDDVVIVSARRTAICKAKRGAFKDTLPDDLLAPVLDAVVRDVGLDKALVDDICVGNVMMPSCGGMRNRMAQFFAGFPETTSLSSVNRQCSSGLQAVMNVASAIKMGTYDIGIGAGVESMTKYQSKEFAMDMSNINPNISDCELAMDCTIPMGITSETVAERYNISRTKQDQLAVLSHSKAAAARKEGRFRDEIVPVSTEYEDKEGNTKQVTVAVDEGIREGTTMEGLAKLKPAFTADGTTTAGNSSQVSDGAAAVLVMRRSVANRLNIPVLGAIRGYKVKGVKPDEMGIGPAVAIPAVLHDAGVTVDDVDVFEINEAFASQATYCVEKLGIPLHKVNPNGGAIALGHPLACTGARQIATLLHEMKRRGKRGYGIVSMCIGSGMGAAALIEYEG